MTGDVSARRTAARVVVVVTTVALAVPLTAAYAADGVRTTRAIEVSPSAGPGAFAWTQAPRSSPQAADAYLQRPGRSRMRLNARGTKGFTAGGAVDEGGGRVAYWQRPGSRADIKLFNLSTGRRTAPGFVNTARHEWGASVSGRWLLFARGRYGGTMTIHLANLRTHRIRRLAQVGDSGYLQPGDVSGRWAVWTRCADFRSCRTIRYNSRSGSSRTLANPRDRSQFGASVLRNGTVFYAESRNISSCGSKLRLFKKTLAGARRNFQTLPVGVSVGVTSTKRVSSSRVAVYYDPQRCDRPKADIYRVRVAG